jgi:cytochrome c biogenesis protein
LPKKRADSISSILSSVKLTLTLLILVALLSIVGTFIPQQESAVEFARQLSPGAARLLYGLQLFDVYHSVLFYLLMGLLSVNLIVCSWSRFPVSWRRFTASPFPAPAGLFNELPHEQVLITDAKKDIVRERLETLLKGKFSRVVQDDSQEGSTIIFADRGRFSLFGVYMVHLSILIMIAGTAVGSLWGLNAYVNIVEGESVAAADLKGGKGSQRLGFSVRCDRFTVDFYENGAPKTYRSDLSFIKDGRVAYQGPALVNHPIEYDGIRFYQASYGSVSDGRAFITYTGGREKDKGIMASVGDRFELPGSGAKAEVLRVEDNLMEMGPAVKLRITSPATDVQFWIFQRIEEIKATNPGLMDEVPLFNPGLFKPYVFSLIRVEQQYYTGLQVVRDPGVPLVAGGGFLMIAGLVVIYFLSHKRLWIRIDGVKERTRISIAGRSNRNAGGMKRLVDRLCTQLIKEMAP